MMETILLILAAAGFDLIITRSEILSFLREAFPNSEKLTTLFSCPQCFGFWSGLIFGIASLSFVNAVTFPFIVSGIGYIITLIENK